MHSNWNKFIFIFFILSFSVATLGKPNLQCVSERAYITKFASRLVKDSCIPIAPNIPTNVTEKRNEDVLDVSYRLTKKNSKAFVIEINPIFIDSKGMHEYSANTFGKTSLIKEISKSSSTHKTYAKKVSYCLDLYEPYLKGPNNEKLTIKISSDKRVPSAYIGIDKPHTRSTYRNYAQDIDCPTVLHEVLHLLGLVDEYPEKSAGFYTDPKTGYIAFARSKTKYLAYDCRAKGPENSIMHLQHEAMVSVAPKKIYDQTTCMCEQDKMQCKVFIQELGDSLSDLKTCPKGFKAQQNKVTLVEGMGLKKLLDSNLNKEDVLSMVASGTADQVMNVVPQSSFDLRLDTKKYKNLPSDGKSLLMPAHFRRITNPFCYSENKEYIECSQFAYSSSILEPNKSCGDKAKKCQSNTDWLQ